MFHANTPQHNKEVILRSLTQPDGVVRVVFATVALGMGINLRDVNTIIHYGGAQSIAARRVGEEVDLVSQLAQLCFGRQKTAPCVKSWLVLETMK
jgi:Lhr-like helicase